jgi:CRP-like cAMP-binding protein
MNNFLWTNIFKRTESEVDVIARLWQQTPLFKNIPARHIRSLAENMHLRNFEPGESVFRQGEQGAGAILVVEGQVKIMASDVQISVLESGDFFGEIALAETDKRTADAFSVKRSRLVYFMKAELEEWTEIEPMLGNIFLINLASILAHRLYLANQMLSHQSRSL